MKMTVKGLITNNNYLYELFNHPFLSKSGKYGYNGGDNHSL